MKKYTQSYLRNILIEEVLDKVEDNVGYNLVIARDIIKKELIIMLKKDWKIDTVYN